MITITSYRYDRCDRNFPNSHRPFGELMSSSTRTSASAARSLVEFELGYGGSVVEASSTSIKVVTHVFSKVDTTIFEGTEEAMQPLLLFAYLFEKMSDEQDFERLFKVLEGSELKEKLLRPLYLVNAGPLLIGQTRVRRACLAFVSEEESDIKLFDNFDTKSLLDAAVFKIDGSLNIEELRQLAA